MRFFDKGSVVRLKRSLGYGPGEQEFGYITIRNGAHVFFWYFYAQDDEPLTKPTVVFLSGGPGTSSTGVANFGEVGNSYVNGTERAAAWVSLEKVFLFFFLNLLLTSGKACECVVHRPACWYGIQRNL